MTSDSSHSAGSAAVAIWRVSHVMGMWWTAAHKAVASPSVSSGVVGRDATWHFGMPDGSTLDVSEWWSSWR